MDRMPGPEIVDPIRRAAESVEGVRATEKLAVRRTGMAYRVTIHVQADAKLPLDEAHILSGRVKSAIRAAVPAVQHVLVHMPCDGTGSFHGRVLTSVPLASTTSFSPSES